MDGTEQTIDGGVGSDTLIVDLGKYSADEFEWDVNLTEGELMLRNQTTLRLTRLLISKM